MATIESELDYSRFVVDEPEKERFCVHRDVYMNEDIFEAEIEKIFESSWLYLAHESQLKQPNDYLTAYMGRQPVILARDNDHHLHCFLNRCRHRGATVCREERGNSNSFRCFYHAWTYKNDGRLIGVADRGGYGPKFSTEDFGLEKVPKLGVYKGFIFASLNPDVPTLEEHLGRARPYLDLLVEKYPSGLDIAKGVTKYGFQGNWKLQVENAMDFYHLPSVHKSQLDIDVARGRRGRITLNTLKENLGVYFGRGHGSTISRDFTGEARTHYTNELEQSDSVESKWTKNLHQHMLIFPNLVVLENPGPQVRVIRPVAVDQTEVRGYAYFSTEISTEERKRKLRAYERFYGPVGMGTPDDAEAFHACMEGYQVKSAPWNDLSRGMHREQIELDISEIGPFEVAGNITDDTVFRGIYRWWVEVMNR